MGIGFISLLVVLCPCDALSLRADIRTHGFPSIHNNLHFIASAQTVSQLKKHSTFQSRNFFSRRPLTTSSPKRLHFINTRCTLSDNTAETSPGEIDLKWDLPSGPPLRVLSVPDSYQPSGFSASFQRDIKISAASGWGDGQHATTSLCMSFLVQNAGPKKVLRALNFATSANR